MSRPDVVLTDIRMPPSNTDEGIRVASELRRTHPSVGVVVLSQYSDPSYVLKLLESGSDRRAYLLKERVHDVLELTSDAQAQITITVDEPLHDGTTAVIRSTSLSGTAARSSYAVADGFSA